MRYLGRRRDAFRRGTDKTRRAFDSASAVDGVVKVDLGPIDVNDDQVDWSSRSIASDQFVAWLSRYSEARRIVVRGVCVTEDEADCESSVDLTNFRTPAELTLRDCRIELQIDLASGKVGRLEILGSDLRQGLRLTDAHITGSLIVGDGAHIAPKESTSGAVGAHRLVVSGGLFIRGEDTRLDGALRLISSTIAGPLTITQGAYIGADSDGRAVVADRLSVEGLFIEGEKTRLAGGLRLIGATIAAALVIRDGAEVAADSSGRAVVADRLNAGGGLFVGGNDTRLGGALRVRGATIASQLAIRHGAHVVGDVDLESATVHRLHIHESGEIVGKFNLSHARIELLRDTTAGWEHVNRNADGGWLLAGTRIEALAGTVHGDNVWTVRQRVEWLEKEATKSRSPFTQVAARYREAGHRASARRVAIAGERATSSLWRRIWVGGTVGYGYRPWLAALWGVVLVLGASFVTSQLGGDTLFVPVDDRAHASCPQAYPCLSPVVYWVETVIPVVDLGQRMAWRINTGARYGDWVQWAQYALDLAGWVLGLLVVAAVTGVIRRD